MYKQEQVIDAFKIYTKLAKDGQVLIEDIPTYYNDDMVRGLVDQFAIEVDCNVITAGERALLIPLVMTSQFHITNESVKKKYLPSKAKNEDIYMMYLGILILFGEFYDSYNTTNATRDFISMEQWLDSINERILALESLEEENLKQLETEYEYNWIAIIEKWNALNDVKDKVNNKNKQTNSRYSFLYIIKSFLLDQGLVEEIGNDEITLSEKAKIIIQRYYMEYHYNRGILEIIYNAERERGN